MLSPRARLCAALVTAAALAGCDPPGVADQTDSITVDPTCGLGSVRLYPNINFGGTPWCVYGAGTLALPAGFSINSYVTGTYNGCFHWRVRERFYALTNVADTNANIAAANAVEIVLPPLPPDASAPIDAGHDDCFNF